MKPVHQGLERNDMNLYYIRYNSLRLRPFRTRTAIGSASDGADGAMVVIKSAMTPEARSHVASFAEKQKRLSEVLPSLSFIPVTEKDGEAQFPFVEGTRLDDELFSQFAFGRKEENLALIQSSLEHLVPGSAATVPFTVTDEFKSVFGEAVPDEGALCLPYSNVDTNFDNIILKDGKWICIDYEWAFSFPIPADFLRYRAVLYFLLHHKKELGNWLDEDTVWSSLGFRGAQLKVYELMEERFQEYVFGKDLSGKYTNRYKKEVQRDLAGTYQKMVQITHDQHALIEKYQNLPPIRLARSARELARKHKGQA